MQNRAKQHKWMKKYIMTVYNKVKDPLTRTTFTNN